MELYIRIYGEKIFIWESLVEKLYVCVRWVCVKLFLDNTLNFFNMLKCLLKLC